MASEVTKPDFSFQWSSGGAIVAPSNTKIQTGWTAEVPPFQWENWSQNRQDNAILHLFQKGISVWDAASNYYFTVSGVRSYVQGSNGLIYVAVQSNLNQNPVTDVSNVYWKIAFADNSTALTTTTGDARYNQRANNLSDVASVATARTNLGVADAVVAGIGGTASNLKLSATGLSAVVTVSADSICVKNTGNAQIVLNTVSVAPTFATAGANGIDVGGANSQTASTWYSVWVIWNGTTTSGLLSLSTTSPTLPVGYTHKARVGWVRTDATANKFPFGFNQYGRTVRYIVTTGTNLTTLPAIAGGIIGNVNVIGSVVSSTVDPFIPPTASIIDFFAFVAATAGVTYTISDTNSYGLYNSTTNPPPIAQNYSTTASAIDFSRSMSRLIVPTTRFIFCASNGSDFSVRCLGWEDNL